MKRKLLAVLSALALLASVYTAYAYLSTRGVQIYLMGTRMGAVLAGTWQLALLLAVILWAPGMIVLLRKLSELRQRRTASAEAQISAEVLADGEEETELLKPRTGAEAETELLEPRTGTEADVAKTDVVSGAREDTEAKPAAPVRKAAPLQVCPNCGHPVSGKRFCARCGTKIGE